MDIKKKGAPTTDNAIPYTYQDHITTKFKRCATTCDRFRSCKANICPLDSNYEHRSHLQGEAICYHLKQEWKQRPEWPSAYGITDKQLKGVVRDYLSNLSRYSIEKYSAVILGGDRLAKPSIYTLSANDETRACMVANNKTEAIAKASQLYNIPIKALYCLFSVPLGAELV